MGKFQKMKKKTLQLIVIVVGTFSDFSLWEEGVSGDLALSGFRISGHPDNYRVASDALLPATDDLVLWEKRTLGFWHKSTL